MDPCARLVVAVMQEAAIVSSGISFFIRFEIGVFLLFIVFSLLFVIHGFFLLFCLLVRYFGFMAFSVYGLFNLWNVRQFNFCSLSSWPGR